MIAEEAPPTGGRCGRRWDIRGDPYAEESGVGAEFLGDTGVIGLWAPFWRCVFNICVVDIDAESYDGRHPQIILSLNERCKEGKYLEDCLEQWHHLTPLVLSLDEVMGEEKNMATKQLASAL